MGGPHFRHPAVCHICRYAMKRLAVSWGIQPKYESSTNIRIKA